MVNGKVLVNKFKVSTIFCMLHFYNVIHKKKKNPKLLKESVANELIEIAFSLMKIQEKKNTKLK